MAIAALAVAVAALAVSACCVAATRFLLQQTVAALSEPFTHAGRTLTPAEERKLREDFHSTLRDRRRVR